MRKLVIVIAALIANPGVAQVPLSEVPAPVAQPSAATGNPLPASGAATLTPGAEAEPQKSLSLDDLKKRAKQIVELSVDGDASVVSAARPVFVEFKGSTRMAALVAEDLTRRGVPASATDQGGPTKLYVSARLSIRGPAGRIAFDLGGMFEKIFEGKPAAEQAQIDPLQSAVFGSTSYLRTLGLTRIGLFDPYLYKYFTVMSVLDATGLHGSLNKAIAGDPRGICLTNCDNWNNTFHWVIVEVLVTTAGREQKARSELKAWMTQIDPQTSFDIAYETLLADRLLKGVR